MLNTSAINPWACEDEGGCRTSDHLLSQMLLYSSSHQQKKLKEINADCRSGLQKKESPISINLRIIFFNITPNQQKYDLSIFLYLSRTNKAKTKINGGKVNMILAFFWCHLQLAGHFNPYQDYQRMGLQDQVTNTEFSACH